MSVTFWLLAAWPASLSPDSIETLAQIQSGEWSNVHSVTYTLFVWITSFGSAFIPGTVVAQSLIILMAIFGVVRLYSSSLVAALYLSAGTFLLPPMGAFASTIWKDVPFTGLIVLGGVALARAMRAPHLTGWIPPLLLLGLGGSFRLNGFAVLVAIGFVGFILVVWARSARTAFVMLGTCLLAAGLSLAISASISAVTAAKTAPTWLTWIPAAADLAYVVANDPDEVPDEVKELVHEYSNGDSLAGASDCSSINNMVFAQGFDGDRLAARTSDIAAAFLDLVKERPDLVVALHLCRGANFIPPPFSSGPKYEHWVALVVYPNDLGFAPPTSLDWIRPLGAGALALWGLSAKWTVWPGLLVIVALIVMVLQVRSGRRGASDSLLSLGSLCIGNLLALAPWSVAQDSRYAYIVVIISYAVAIPFLITALSRLRNALATPTPGSTPDADAQSM